MINRTSISINLFSFVLSSNQARTFLNIFLGLISLTIMMFVFTKQSIHSVFLNFLGSDNQSRMLNDHINHPLNRINNNSNEYLSKIINDISKEQYNGNWTFNGQNSSRAILNNESDGIVELRFSQKINETKQETELYISFKCLIGRFIDNWKIIQSSTLEKEIQINYMQSSIQLIGNYSTSIKNGQLFKHSNTTQGKIIYNNNLILECDSIIIITIDKNNNGIIDKDNMQLSFKALCGYEVDLKLVSTSVKNSLTEKINFYVFISSTTATISMAINFYLIKILTQAESNIKALSLTFISMNTLWDFYCFIMNLIFSINHLDYFFQLSTSAFLFFSLVLLVDCQLLYCYFKIQKKTMPQAQLLRKAIIFGILFTFGIIIAFLKIYDFFFTKIYVIFLLIMLWTPQVVHNVLWNNNTALPLVYTVLQTVTRLIVPLYFRGYAHNCFSIANKKYFITQCIPCVMIPLTVVIMQSFFGARFFLPKFLQKDEAKEIYYYSQEDARNIHPDSMNEDCVICLTKLYDQAALLTVQNKEDLSFNMGNLSIFDQSIRSNVLSLSTDRLAFLSNVALSLLLDFHEWKLKVNKINLPYMITQCNHVFHSQCLELWLRQMKKCPSCRKEITVITF